MSYSIPPTYILFIALIIIIIVALLFYFLWNEKCDNNIIYIKRNVITEANKRIDLFDVVYTQIIGSLAVTSNKDCDVELHVIGNDPSTGEIIDTLLFDKKVFANTTGYIGVIRNGEVIDKATFYLKSIDDNVKLTIVAVGFNV